MSANETPQLDAPIVLVHGLCGYERISAFGRPLKDYFPGIREKLEAAGNRVLVPRLSCTLGVAARAAELKRYIERAVPRGPVHLIGHSMGGLDGRYMVSRLGMAARVKSLTTVGTPHRGTAFADWCLRRVGRLVMPFFKLLGLSYQAFLDLTTQGCRRFNASVPDVPGVRYLSVAGRCESEWMGPEWRVPHGIVSRAEGPNDGVVSVASAVWGEHTDVWDGDHLNLVELAEPDRGEARVRRGLRPGLRPHPAAHRPGVSHRPAARTRARQAGQPLNSARPLPFANTSPAVSTAPARALTPPPADSHRRFADGAVRRPPMDE